MNIQLISISSNLFTPDQLSKIKVGSVFVLHWMTKTRLIGGEYKRFYRNSVAPITFIEYTSGGKIAKVHIGARKVYSAAKFASMLNAPMPKEVDKDLAVAMRFSTDKSDRARILPADKRMKTEAASLSASAKKEQVFSDVTVRTVAKEFKSLIATLSKMTKQQRSKAYSKVHMGIGKQVRNFIRTKTKEKAEVKGQPITMDAIWSKVLDRAIELGLYSESDVNIYDLAELTGSKVKELDLVKYSDAADVKKASKSIQNALVRAFGSGITVDSRVRVPFSPSKNVPAHKYNCFTVELPINMQTSKGGQSIIIYLGTSVVFLVETDKIGKTVGKEHIKEANLAKGTNTEIAEAIINNIRIKTINVPAPKASGNYNVASQYVVDTFGKDMQAKGIEMFPMRGGIAFYHPRRGVVKASFSERDGVPVYTTKFKTSFGETFTRAKSITKKTIDVIIKPLLK